MDVAVLRDFDGKCFFESKRTNTAKLRTRTEATSCVADRKLACGHLRAKFKDAVHF